MFDSVFRSMLVGQMSNARKMKAFGWVLCLLRVTISGGEHGLRKGGTPGYDQF